MLIVKKTMAVRPAGGLLPQWMTMLNWFFRLWKVFFSLVLGGNSLKSKLNMLYSCEDTWQGPQIWPLWNHFVGPSNIHSRHLDFSVTTEAYHTNSWEK